MIYDNFGFSYPRLLGDYLNPWTGKSFLNQGTADAFEHDLTWFNHQKSGKLPVNVGFNFQQLENSGKNKCGNTQCFVPGIEGKIETGHPNKFHR